MNAREFEMLERAVAPDHRYRGLKARMQPAVEAIPQAGDARMLYMIVLQVCEELPDGRLLPLLRENFCARWFCGFALTDPIPSQEEYLTGKRSLGAYVLTRLVRQALGEGATGERFLSALELVLGEAPLLPPGGEGRLYALAADPEPELVLCLNEEPSLRLCSLRRERTFLLLGVRGAEDCEARLGALSSRMPRLCLGASCAQGWKIAAAQAEAALQEARVQGRTGLCVHPDRPTPLRIVNLMLSDKRLTLENALKESRMDQAVAICEDILEHLRKNEKELQWFQIRFELFKLFISLYNGGLHYQHDERFYADFRARLEHLEVCSLSQAAALCRECLAGFKAQQFEEVITVNFSNYALAAKETIEKYYATDLSLGDVARSFGITPEYLSSIFRKTVGRNFVEYLQDVRISQACRLLAHSNIRVSEAAHMVGFSSADYFSKVFRQKMHVTPRAYQRSKNL